jgi:hypothetical protein
MEKKIGYKAMNKDLTWAWVVLTLVILVKNLK